MKLLLQLVVLNFNLLCYPQQSGAVQVEYQLFCDTSMPTKFYTTLFAGNNVSVYQEKYGTSQDWSERAKPVPEGRTITKATSDYAPYIKIDRNKKQMHFFALMTRHNFLVEDIYHEFQWNITKDTKDIGGYQCIKATTSYRGRDWAAWFTPDIPMPFGPWKLHGLPGLILEAYDTDNKYTIKLVKIEFKKAPILDKEFATLMQTRNTEPITYKKFMEEREEIMDNLSKSNPNPNVTIVRNPVPRSGEELKFEWE